LEEAIEQQGRDLRQHKRDLERRLKELESDKDALRGELRSEYETRLSTLETRNRKLEIAMAIFEGTHTAKMNLVERASHRQDQI